MTKSAGHKAAGAFLQVVGVIGAAAMIFAFLWVLGWLQPFGLGGGLGGGDVQDSARPPLEAVEVEQAGPIPADDYWSCAYDPTMNDDWHDDILCSRGAEQIRPSLLPDSSFVGYSEIMQAARDYETVLNG
ncbi:hypothetical protein [Conyzicola sp.]|uniref:hypothetical protein n=1 Tax=Conyzicola sp. TaxID=1969404 RepID=UPI00398A2F32